MWTEKDRVYRVWNKAKQDQRPPFARDRDRILYSSAFQRLAGVTQIVRVGEADVFHTRQQHTIKVAQVGRRLAEHIVHKQKALAAKIGLNAEVVEAACLAHDLGHPPFGHIAEEKLNELVSPHDSEGFEGNAQSFRIVTKLAVRFKDNHGLDLTRATLAATLKYPWFRGREGTKQHRKWGAYQSERREFEIASEFLNGHRSAEAELMDWADDISYSVHDLEEFHRCGAIPWNQIYPTDSLQVSRSIVARLVAEMRHSEPGDVDRFSAALDRLGPLLAFLEFRQPYTGERDQRFRLRATTSQLIGLFIQNTALKDTTAGPFLDIPQERLDEVAILKQLVYSFVISSPSLVAQQTGQKRIIEELWCDLRQDTSNGAPPKYLPHRLKYLWNLDGTSTSRFVCDCITSLTENETVRLHSRLRGTSSGSVLDPIVR